MSAEATQALDTDHRFRYLTDAQGAAADVRDPSFEITENDRLKIKALLPKMFDEMTHIVRERAGGGYGIVFEGSEIPAQGDEGYIEPGRFDGQVVNGKLLAGDELPTFEDAVAHIVAERDHLNAMFPGLSAQIFYGDSTFNGHPTLRAYVPEGSPLIDRIAEIGAAQIALWKMEDITHSPSL